MGLPPTSSKISTDSNEVTTFKFDFPNFTGTHTGTDLSLGINSVAGGGTGLGTLTLNNVILGNGTSTPNFVAPSTSGNVLTSNGTTWVSSPASSGGTVTSVAMTMPGAIFNTTVSGSPITTSGTLAPSLLTQTANTILAGPTSGSAATPTFRQLTNADLPSGVAAFASYSSTQVTSTSSNVTATAFTTFSNSPAFTFTPTITGTYKVYCSIPVEQATPGVIGVVRITNTSGSATLIAESQAALDINLATVETLYVQSQYTLTAGTAYQFDIQGQNIIGSGALTTVGSIAPFYMFAEGIGLATSSPTGSYAQAYFSSASSWSTTSATYVDPTNSGGNALTVRQSNNIILTAAASNVCGVTFTPPNSSAVYLITAIAGVYSGSITGGLAIQMIDGSSTVISNVNGYAQAATAPDVALAQTISGIYVPGSSSPVTVKLQLASFLGTVNIEAISGTGLTNSVEWTILRIV